MIRTFYFTQESGIRTDFNVSEIPTMLQNENGLLWVDFQGNPPEEDEPVLRDIFQFHPLAIDDALQELHVPKLDDWGSYLYIVLSSVMFAPLQDEYLNTPELDVFLGRNYMVTHHDEAIEAVEHLWSVLPRDVRHLQHGADHLLYRLVDDVTADYMPVVEQLDDQIDRTEDEIFERPTPELLARIFALKRASLHLRRIISPQREVLNKLARDDFDVIDAHDRIYFRDVYDHLVRLYDISESLRDLVSGTLDTYLSVVNNRMNDIMKTLTIITTMFMPISFVAAFFGMNFIVPHLALPWLTSYTTFVVGMVVMLLTPVGMYMWIHSKGWM